MIYSDNSVIIKKSEKKDIYYLSQNLREEDRVEVFLSHGHSPREALEKCLDSIHCYTSLNAKTGVPICMFGVNPEMILDDKAVVWMLSTEELFKIKIKFLKKSKIFINEMLQIYPCLYNHVHAKNIKSIEWLTWLGAKFGNLIKVNDTEYFQYFEFKR